MKILPFFAMAFLLLQSCGDTETKQSEVPQSHSGYISSRDVLMQLREKGYQFGEPTDLDSMERIRSDGGEEHIILFYRNDTLLEADAFKQVKEDRNDMRKNSAPITSVMELFDPQASQWSEQQFLKADPKKEMSLEKSFNKHHYLISYTPGVDMDVIQANFYKDEQ